MAGMTSKAPGIHVSPPHEDAAQVEEDDMPMRPTHSIDPLALDVHVLPGRAASKQRRTAVSRGSALCYTSENDDVLEKTMDKVLFEDDSKGGEYLKSLISSHGLRTAWEKLAKRMKNLEDATGVKKNRSMLTPKEIEKAFASRKECQEICIEQYEERFIKQEQRIQALESAQEPVLKRFEANEKDVSQIHEKLLEHWEVIGLAQEDILRVERQDNEHQEKVLALHEDGMIEISKQEELTFQTQKTLTAAQGAESQKNTDLRGAIDALRDFLYSAGLQKQLETICSDMLSQYVSKEDMTKEKETIHERAVEAVTPPFEASIRQLTQTVQAGNEYLANKDIEINDDIVALGERVSAINQKFLDRVDDVVSQVNQRAMESRVADAEKRLTSRMEYSEEDFTEFKEVQTKKIEDSYDRVHQLESSIFAHEHALEHWAEEIGNRATKYDTMVLSSRLDKCALKDKTDADYKETVKTLKWQSVKIENLTYKNSFGGDDASSAGGRKQPSVKGKKSTVTVQVPKQSPTPSDGTGAGDELASESSRIIDGPAVESMQSSIEPAPEATKDSETAAVEAGYPVSASEGATVEATHSSYAHFHTESEVLATLSQQVESLGQCLLGVGHLTLRTAVCGLSREARMEREDRMIYHIGSVIYWMQHRVAPHGWDPMELQSLALKCMDNNTHQKQHARHGSELHHSSHHAYGSSKQLSKADTWASDHLLTSLHSHADHLPTELSEIPRHPTAFPVEDPSPVPHQPVAISHRASERSASDQEREERRQRAGPTSSRGRTPNTPVVAQPKRSRKLKNAGTDGEGVRDHVMAVFGEEGRNSAASRGSARGEAQKQARSRNAPSPVPGVPHDPESEEDSVALPRLVVRPNTGNASAR